MLNHTTVTPFSTTQYLGRICRSSRRALAGGVVLSSLLVGGAFFVDGAFVSSAHAQTTVDAVTAYYAVVTKDGTSLQCRLGSAAYSVKSLKAGDVLRVVGHSAGGAGWAQAEYPAGMSAFVKIDEASTIENGKALKLTKNSRLMAANVDGGVNWWYLLDKELPAGTTFSVNSVVKGSDGKESGYLVPAPKGSLGFVRRDALRQATASEIEAWQKATGATPPPAAKPAEPVVKPSTTPAPVAPPSTPATTPSTPTTVPDPTKPIFTTPPSAPSPTPAVTPPSGTTPGTTPGTTVPPEATPSATPPTTPADGTAAAPVTPPATPHPKPVTPARPKVDVEALSSLYMSAMTKADGEMEMGAVIGEYDKALSSIEATGDTARLRRQLQARRDALKLRSDLQEALRASDQRLASIRDKSRGADDLIAKFERERQFAVVGRLMASTVYDGTKLPLMYRVASTDPIAPRTLAYVVPTSSIVLSNMIGEMVGVAGDKKYDEQLKVNVITPTRAEVVTVPAVDLPVAPPAPATNPTPGGGGAPSTLTPDGVRTEVPIRPVEK